MEGSFRPTNDAEYEARPLPLLFASPEIASALPHEWDEPVPMRWPWEDADNGTEEGRSAVDPGGTSLPPPVPAARERVPGEAAEL
jgi:hypothetical protein